jgi:SAM-dependent methyltransferase
MEPKGNCFHANELYISSFRGYTSLYWNQECFAMGDKAGLLYNLLNRPFVFNAIRSILDGGQLKYISRILEGFNFESVLDVCCGCGAFSRVSNDYTGVDYNQHFIQHARRRYGLDGKKFLAADIQDLDPHTKYDVSMIINSIHHFSDTETVAILRLMSEITRKIVLVHDLIPLENIISKFFYAIDRGQYIRTLSRQREIIREAGLFIESAFHHRTFPGIYMHSTFLCFRE